MPSFPSLAYRMHLPLLVRNRASHIECICLCSWGPSTGLVTFRNSMLLCMKGQNKYPNCVLPLNEDDILVLNF